MAAIRRLICVMALVASASGIAGAQSGPACDPDIRSGLQAATCPSAQQTGAQPELSMVELREMQARREREERLASQIGTALSASTRRIVENLGR